MNTSFDFNKIGNEYINLAIKDQSSCFEVLNPMALEVYEFYKKYANQKLKESSGEEAEKLTLLCAAFDRLIGFFLQLSRVGDGVNKLVGFRDHLEKAINKIPDKSKIPDGSLFSPPGTGISY